ncbi:MAG: hypothetical protein QOE33_59 [Acidobacteriota bacterium]|nr:hypothetical protein [Acidobacteriota bacterium]
MALIAPWLWDASAWRNMFWLSSGPDATVSVVEKVLRTLIVYALLVVLLRVFGKRELAQLNPFDLVVLLLLSNAVQNAIIGPDNSVIGGAVGALTLLLANYLVVRFLFKHRRLDQIIEGSPTTLIEGGVLKRDALAHELLTEAELLTVAHRQGFDSIDEIDTCVIEPGGLFFIKGKTPSSGSRQHQELITRLDELSKQIEELRGKR